MGNYAENVKVYIYIYIYNKTAAIQSLPGQTICRIILGITVYQNPEL